MKQFKSCLLQNTYAWFISNKSLHFTKDEFIGVCILALYILFPVQNACADVKLQYSATDSAFFRRDDVKRFATAAEAEIYAIPKFITEDHRTCKWDARNYIYKDCANCVGTHAVTTLWTVVGPIHCPIQTYYGISHRITHWECDSVSYFDNTTAKCVVGTDPNPECPFNQQNETADANGNGVLDCPLLFNKPKNLGFCLSCTIKKLINSVLGNPVNIGTGNKFQVETDYQSPVQGGLSYRRYYNSFGDDAGLATRYGNGWTADYWQRIVPVSSTEMEIQRPDGKHLRFKLNNGVWTPDADVVMRLHELTDSQGNRTGWRLTLADDTVEEYDSDNVNVGRPIAITTRSGRTTTLEYNLTAAQGGDDIPTSLDRVTDAYGRSLSFHYDTNAHLVSVTDPAGNDIRYTRDASGNLTSVIYPDATPADPNDNPERIYHYEDTNFPHALTGITDADGNRFASWTYDSYGRAISSEHAGGAGRIDIVYHSDATATVTDAGGASSTYTFTSPLGVVKPAQITGDPCSDCGSAQSVTYDANGYPASATDLNGNVTNYVYNSRGLETSRTEAVGTPQERTITTTWHPDFRLPLTITEPGKVTAFTYDSQGNLLERKEEVAP